RRIRNSQAFDVDVGNWQQAGIDLAADTHFTACKPRSFLLDGAAIAIPIDGGGDDEQRRERRDDQDAEDNQSPPHDRLIVSLCATAPAKSCLSTRSLASGVALLTHLMANRCNSIRRNVAVVQASHM